MINQSINFLRSFTPEPCPCCFLPSSVASNMPSYFSAPPFHHLLHSRCVSAQQRWGRAWSRWEIWLGHTVAVLKMNEWAAVSVCTAIMQQTFNQPKTAPAHRLPVQLWSGHNDSLLSISRQTSSCIFIPPLCPYKYIKKSTTLLYVHMEQNASTMI